MKRSREKWIVENMGVTDRMLRLLFGSLLIIPVIVAMAEVTPLTWEIYGAIFACYLLLTGMMGWEPLYEILHARTCDISKKGPCGSFTYELDTALGRRPDHDRGYETHALKPFERVTGVYYEGYWL